MTAPGTPVLVVDDEPVIRRLVSRLLTQRGYAARCAATAEEALGALESEPKGFSLLVTDVNLEKMSGADLARLARRASPSLGVIFLTGDPTFADGGPRERGVVLTKPFSPEDLLDAVSRALAPRE